MTTPEPSLPRDLDQIAREVKAHIENAEVEPLLQLIAPLHPADIAETMERLDRFEQNFLFDALEPEVGSQVLLELEDATREDVLEGLDEQRLGPMVDEMDSDDAADIVGELDEEVRERVLQQVPEEHRVEVETLLTYPEDSAGGIMALEVPWVRKTHTVARAIEMIREHHRDMEEISEIFVVDRERRLVGSILPVELLLADPDALVADIMDTEAVSVRPETDQQEAAAVASKYDLLNVPVTDDRNRLLGVITYDDIFDVIEEEEHEDISYIAGTGEDEPAERSVMKAVRERGPWLMLGLGGSIGSAMVMAAFEGSLKQHLAVAFFVPAVMATAGSVAIQASSLVVRGLATGSFALQGVPIVLWRELRTSVLLGVGLGILLGLFAFVWMGNGALALCLLSALGLVVINAALSGTMIPLALKRVGIDPAVAMGPFITTLNDVMGIAIYLLVVLLFLSGQAPAAALQ
ncbi:MAG: magnesium transporter [Planctomycetes bacterium]|nr:magnesium transporter [Planctomycetota bacterium]